MIQYSYKALHNYLCSFCFTFILISYQFAAICCWSFHTSPSSFLTFCLCRSVCFCPVICLFLCWHLSLKPQPHSFFWFFFSFFLFFCFPNLMFVCLLQFGSENQQLEWAKRESEREEQERLRRLRLQEQQDLELAIALSKADLSNAWPPARLSVHLQSVYRPVTAAPCFSNDSRFKSVGGSNASCKRGRIQT